MFRAALFSLLALAFAETHPYARTLLPGEVAFAYTNSGPASADALLGRHDVADFLSYTPFGPLLLLTNGTISNFRSNPPVNSEISAIAPGDNFVWLLQTSGIATRWSAPPLTNILWTNIKQITALFTNSAAVTLDGDVIFNGVSQGFNNVKKVILGQDESYRTYGIVLFERGALRRLGTNGPAFPKNLTNVLDIAIGDGHVIAVLSDHSVVGWGANNFAQATPPLITNAVSVFAWDSESWAVLDSGDIRHWGATNSPLELNFSGVARILRGGYLIGGNPPASPPQILSFENRQQRRTGARLRLFAEVTGSLPLFYQWYKNNSPILNATNSDYAILSAFAEDAGSYSLFLSNSLGTARSPDASIEILPQNEPQVSFWVTNSNVAGPGSLSEAMASSESGAVIGIDVLGDLYIPIQYIPTTELSYAGVSPAYTRFHALSMGQLFSVSRSGVLHLESLNLAFAKYTGGGGAISNAGTLTISECRFENNEALREGGAIANTGKLTVSRTRFFRNRGFIHDDGLSGTPAFAAGGAISSHGGTVSIVDCEFSENTAFGDDSWISDAPSSLGGAIALFNSTALIGSSTFAFNQTRSGRGGPGTWGSRFPPWYPPGRSGVASGSAIFATNSQFTIVNSTFASNVSLPSGQPAFDPKTAGTIFGTGSSTGLVLFSTIVSPDAAIIAESTNAFDLALFASVLFNPGNSPNYDTYGPVRSLGFNVIHAPGALPLQITDLSNLAPDLGPLTANGGFGRTFLPSWTSPLLDHGPIQTGILSDQRGFPRLAGSAADIGAVELPFISPHVDLISSDTNVAQGSQLKLFVAASGPLPIAYQWLHNAIELRGATNDSLLVNSFSETDAGTYSVRLTNPAGSAFSPPIKVAFTSMPLLQRSLENLTIAPHEPVTFSVEASGPDLTYSWFYNQQPIPGENLPTLTLANRDRSQAGTYTVRISNPFGQVESSANLSFWPVIEVASLADRGPNTLRNAISLANLTPEAFEREIVFTTNGTVSLESPLSPVTASISISGSSPAQNKVDGKLTNILFTVSSTGRLSLVRLTLSRGSARHNESGGAIHNDGFLEIQDCLLISNRTDGGFGGAVFNAGALTANNSSFISNFALGDPSIGGGGGAGFGGAIFSQGSVAITNSTFSGNAAFGGNAGQYPVTQETGRGGGPEGGRTGDRTTPVRLSGFGGGGARGPVGYDDSQDVAIAYPGGAGGFGGGGGESSVGGSPAFG